VRKRLVEGDEWEDMYIWEDGGRSMGGKIF